MRQALCWALGDPVVDRGPPSSWLPPNFLHATAFPGDALPSLPGRPCRPPHQSPHPSRGGGWHGARTRHPAQDAFTPQSTWTERAQQTLLVVSCLRLWVSHLGLWGSLRAHGVSPCDSGLWASWLCVHHPMPTSSWGPGWQGQGALNCDPSEPLGLLRVRDRPSGQGSEQMGPR